MPIACSHWLCLSRKCNQKSVAFCTDVLIAHLHSIREYVWYHFKSKHNSDNTYLFGQHFYKISLAGTWLNKVPHLWIILSCTSNLSYVFHTIIILIIAIKTIHMFKQSTKVKVRKYIHTFHAHCYIGSSFLCVCTDD